MTQLETAVVRIMDSFNEYASKEGKKNTLNKAELRNLMEKEFPGTLKGGKGKDDCDKLLEDLDANCDSEVDFKEFIIFLATFTCLAHEKFQKCTKK